ncbi:MAG TPA: helix-turn-helix domain-containing protein [Anaeromyxobacter sp.]|nr:helix-turn-helix domain-containing protein [Anaeromyxobacter sp.]
MRTVLVESDPQRRAELGRILEAAGHSVALVPDLAGAYLEALAGEELRASGKRGRPSLAELDRRYAREILQQTGGNKTRAAEILAIDRKTLYRLIGEGPAHRHETAAPDNGAAPMETSSRNA